MTESNHPWHGSTCSDPCSHRSDYYIITWAHTHLQLSLHFYLIKHLQRHDCINDTGCTGVEQLELDYGDPQLKTNMGHGPFLPRPSFWPTCSDVNHPQNRPSFWSQVHACEVCAWIFLHKMSTKDTWTPGQTLRTACVVSCYKTGL